MIGNELPLIVVFLLLGSMAVLAFIVSGYDILHPFTIVSSVMAFSALLSVMAPEAWHISISFLATIVVFVAVLCFGAGCLLSDWCIRSCKAVSGSWERKRYYISNSVIFCICIVLLIFTYFNFWEVYQASLKLGNQGDYMGMISVVRRAVENSEYSFSRFYSYRNQIAQVLVYYSIFVFFWNVFLNKTSSILAGIKYFLPLVFYLPLLILSGARIGLFCMVVFMIVSGCILYQKSCEFDFSSKKKSLYFAFGGGACFLVFFLLFGFFTGKVTLPTQNPFMASGRNPFEIICHYGGLSLPALSVYLESTFLETPYLGASTFHAVYHKLISLGMEQTDVLLNFFHFLPFTNFDGVTTNVYTALRPYIQDYGFWGTCLVMAILGMVYTAMYNYVRLYAKNPVWIVVYANIAWPLVWIMNEDGFFKGIVQTQTIYFILLIFLMDWVFSKLYHREM